jgi:hypothetical protein
LHPVGSVCTKTEHAIGHQQLRAVARVHERETLSLDERLRDRLAVQFDQLRLVVQQLELARAAGHEKVNDVLRFWRVMAALGRHRILEFTRAAR